MKKKDKEKKDKKKAKQTRQERKVKGKVNPKEIDKQENLIEIEEHEGVMPFVTIDQFVKVIRAATGMDPKKTRWLLIEGDCEVKAHNHCYQDCPQKLEGDMTVSVSVHRCFPKICKKVK